MTFEQDLAALFNKMQPARALPPLPGPQTIAAPTTIPGLPSPVFAQPRSSPPASLGVPPMAYAEQRPQQPHFFGPAPQIAQPQVVDYFQPTVGIQPANGMPPGLGVLVGADAPLLLGTIPPIGTNVVVFGLPGTPQAGFPPVMARTAPPNDDSVRYPWPCGRPGTKESWEDLFFHADAAVAAAIPYLEDHGSYGTGVGCERIVQALLAGNEKALGKLRGVRALLPPGASMGAKLDVLIECGEAISDFEPFTSALTSMMDDFAMSGGESADPCKKAQNGLRQAAALSPGQLAANLLGIIAQVAPSNATSRLLMKELQSIVGELALAGTGLGLGPAGATLGANLARDAGTRLNAFYFKMINGSFCDCPTPGGPILQ